MADWTGGVAEAMVEDKDDEWSQWTQAGKASMVTAVRRSESPSGIRTLSLSLLGWLWWLWEMSGLRRHPHLDIPATLAPDFSGMDPAGRSELQVDVNVHQSRE